MLLSKSNILSIKLDEEGGGVAEWDGPVDRSEAARMPHLRHGRVASVAFVVVVVLIGDVGAGVAAPPLVVVKDRQLAVLVAQVGTITRRLANAQWWGQAP